MLKSGSIQIRVRYNECDPMGVAHHSAYAIWFEIGRTELLRQTLASSAHEITTYRDLEQHGIFLAVVALNVRYKIAAKYDDLLDLRTTLTAVGHVKIEHEYALHRDGLLLATGSTTLACLNRDGRPQEIPAVLRADSA